MTNLWPLFTTINSIKVDSSTLDCIQCEHHDLTKPLLASARILHSTLFFFVIRNTADNKKFLIFKI
jgi:hypothetical protein